MDYDPNDFEVIHSPSESYNANDFEVIHSPQDQGGMANSLEGKITGIGVDKEGEFEKQHPIKAAISKYGRPILETGGLLLGGTLGTPADIGTGPGGTVLGASLGYGGGKSAANSLDILLNTPQGQDLKKRSAKQIAGNSLQDLLAGATSEIGGQTAAPVLGTLLNPIASSIKGSAQASVSRALRPTTIENKAITERITPQILENPKKTFALTQKGLLEKTDAQREAAGEAINAFGKLEGDVNPKQVSEALDKLKQPYVIDGKVIDKDAIARIDSMKENIDQFGDSISKEGLRKFTRTLGSEIRAAKGYVKDANLGQSIEIKKIADSEMRNILSEEEPDLSKLNKQFNFWANYNDVISATSKRTLSQSGLPIVAGIAGAATGENNADRAARATAFALAVEGIRSPGFNLASAHVKNQLAKTLSNLAIPSAAKSLGATVAIQKGLGSLSEEQQSKLDEFQKNLQMQKLLDETKSSGQ